MKTCLTDDILLDDFLFSHFVCPAPSAKAKGRKAIGIDGKPKGCLVRSAT